MIVQMRLFIRVVMAEEGENIMLSDSSLTPTNKPISISPPKCEVVPRAFLQIGSKMEPNA